MSSTSPAGLGERPSELRSRSCWVKGVLVAAHAFLRPTRPRPPEPNRLDSVA